VIEVVHGRADDILDLPGNTGGRVTLHPIHLRRLLATVREVVSYQITQRPREIDIQVMLTTPDPGLPSRIAERILAVLRAHGVADIPVRVHPVETIARAPGTGKLKLIEVVRDAPLEASGAMASTSAS
jgi:phenylacetate-coenzyme A ligase PaaK-like adenylate-forming protein